MAVLRGDDDMRGYLEGLWHDYTVYRMDGGGAVSFWGGWAWNQFTTFVAGSDSKFTYTPPDGIGHTGVRG